MGRKNGWQEQKDALIEKIIPIEWSMFSALSNIGGQADCQRETQTFIDIKHMDSNRHFEKTGVHTELIHHNIKAPRMNRSRGEQ